MDEIIHQIHKVGTQEMFKTNAETYLALLQIRSTPHWSGLCSPATLLICNPIRGIMPVIIRALSNTNNNDDYYEVLMKRQKKADKNHDTLRHYNSIPTGPPVAVYLDNRGLWTLGTITDKDDHNHNDWSHRVWVMKTGGLITRSRKYVKATPLTAKQYLTDKLSKDRKMSTPEDMVKHLEQQAWEDENYT